MKTSDGFVLTIPSLLTREECAAHIELANGLGFVAQQFRGQERVEVRNRVSVDDPRAAAELWSKLEGKLITLPEFFRDGLRPDPGSPILYLNDDFEGGETDFFGFQATPRTGSAIAFAHERRHEGRPVYAGTKYVVRTDVMYRSAS